jgi:hypothetical protein
MSTAVKEIRFEERLDRELERLMGQEWKEEFSGADVVTSDELFRWLQRRLNGWVQGQSNVPKALVDQQGLVSFSDVQQQVIRQWGLTASRAPPSPAEEPDLPPELGLDDAPQPPMPSQPLAAPRATQSGPNEAVGGAELVAVIERARHSLGQDVARVGEAILRRVDSNAARAASAEGLAGVADSVSVQAVELKVLISVIAEALEALHRDVHVLNAAVEATQGAVASQGRDLARMSTAVDNWSSPYVPDDITQAEMAERAASSSRAVAARPPKAHHKKK